jgi:hypothetical protein
MTQWLSRSAVALAFVASAGIVLSDVFASSAPETLPTTQHLTSTPDAASATNASNVLDKGDWQETRGPATRVPNSPTFRRS